MKKIFSCITIILLLLTLLTQSFATEPNVTTDEIAVNTVITDLPLLSEMSEDECIHFIKQQNITIPDDYSEDRWASFVKQIITIVEDNPYHEFSFSYTVTLSFANAIKDAVIDYYGLCTTNSTAIPQDNTIPASIGYILQDSDELGIWIDAYNHFNCYIYSIGTPSLIYKNPGYRSETNMSLNMGVLGIADLAVADLNSLGHARVFRSSTMDTSNLCTNEQIICLRLGEYDYHFMRYEDGVWKHKPGKSAILRYKYVPSVMRKWTSEGFFQGGAVAGVYTYDGPIIYISYDGHNWEYTPNGNGTHVKSCNICDDVILEDCELKYTGINSSKHSVACKECSYSVASENCSFVTTSNDDGTHSIACSDCSNETTESCGLVYTNLADGRHSISCAECDYRIMSTLCDLTYTANDNNTHTADCALCGNSYVADCRFSSEYIGSGQHSNECINCGTSHTAACVSSHSYCGDGTSSHVHSEICQSCGNAMSTGTESCTFAYKYNGQVDGSNTHVYACTACGYIKAAPIACIYVGSNPCKFCGSVKGFITINTLAKNLTEE